MYWNTIAGWSGFLTHLFDEIPPLSEFSINSFSIATRTRNASIVLTSNNPVDHVPKKWEQQGHTYATLRLGIEYVYWCSYTDRGDLLHATLQLDELDELVIRCTVSGTESELKFLCASVCIREIHGSAK